MAADSSSEASRSWLPALRPHAVLYAILAVCITIELVLQLADLGVLPLPRLRQTAYEYAGFWPGLMGPWRPNYTWQPYTMFLSYSLLHGGLMHTVFNMATLLSLGPPVIARVGQRGFLVIFATAVLGGALCYGLLQNGPNPMVGASGALFGLAGAILAWNYIDRFAAQRRLTPILQAVLLLAGLNVVLWWLMGGHLAWETHLGGFLAGWVSALLVDPRTLPDPEDAPEPPPRSGPT